jgi:endogenous inhibitor of DNA gyrase (YacG/DUF329 family)
MPKCPKCGKKVDFFYIREDSHVCGTMTKDGNDWETDYIVSDSIARCPKCDENIDWETAIALMGGA